ATLPGSLSNLTTTSTSSSMFVFDQDPIKALASGQSQTRFFSLSPDAQAQPLHVTVAWTDPPGNPAAAVKLVNDLDLIVTNLDTGEVFLGNNILAGNEYNLPATNLVTDGDAVNNVENIYLEPPLGTNFSVTVAARRVNVNAVTAHTNDTVQDYALVVSSGDGQITNALTLASDPGISTAPSPNVTMITNTFSLHPGIGGAVLSGQRAGA